MLPDGWTKEPIGDRVSIKHGFAFASSHFNLSGDGYRLLHLGILRKREASATLAISRSSIQVRCRMVTC